MSSSLHTFSVALILIVCLEFIEERIYLKPNQGKSIEKNYKSLAGNKKLLKMLIPQLSKLYEISTVFLIVNGLLSLILHINYI